MVLVLSKVVFSRIRHRRGRGCARAFKVWGLKAQLLIALFATLLLFHVALLRLHCVVTEPSSLIACNSTDSASRQNASTKRMTQKVVLMEDVLEWGYEWSNPELCPLKGAHLQVLIFVSSSPHYRKRRDAVRDTWGQYTRRSDIALVFMLGAPPPSLRSRLYQELIKHGDIVVGRFVDSYSNLTLKTLSMLEWANTYCPLAPRILKTDDDVFVNVPLLLRFMANETRINARNTIWGWINRGWLPIRGRSKNHLSRVQFPGSRLPDFAQGAGYLMTSDIVPGMLAKAPEEPYLRLEDVFVTGVMAARLGVRLRQASEFYCTLYKKADPCRAKRAVTIHIQDKYFDSFDLWYWHKMFQNQTQCANLFILRNIVRLLKHDSKIMKFLRSKNMI